MIPWLHERAGRIAGVVGITALSIVDVATGDYVAQLRNGIWALDGEIGFHLALWLAWGAFAWLILQR